MDAPAAARFAAACGAAGPIDLIVEKDDGTVVAKGVIDQPFAVVGRDPACDVCLADPAISPKHAYLQVIGGHVFVTDLGSPTGIEFPEGRRPCGWLTPNEPIRLGPFRIRLNAPVSDAPTQFGPTFHPFAAGPDVPATLAGVEIEFRNGRTSRNLWSVNRVLTLIGRAKDCKISLAGDDISQFHCCLVLAGDGLWAVDLLGRGGMRVNGHLVRHQRLNHNDELKVGQFVLGCLYQLSPGDNSFVSFELPKRTPLAHQPSLAELTDALGSDPAGMSQATMGRVRDPATDRGPLALPPQSTHMTVAPGESGKTDIDLDQYPAHGGLFDSAPELYPYTPPPLSGIALDPIAPYRTIPTLKPAAALGGFEAAVVPMLRQLGDMQEQMFAQFQQSLMIMMRTFGQLPREQVGAVQQELDRMAELNVELQKLQTEMAKMIPAEATVPASKLPGPDTVPSMSPDTAALHVAVWEKMTALDSERQSIWQRLYRLMSKPGG